MRPPLIDLLCLPCAGGSAAMYMRWRRLLPDWIRVVPIELPGRGARLAEPAATDFDALVERLCDEHAETLQRRPAVFGHSMGALLTYGIALRQRALGRPQPRMLFVSGSPAPKHRARNLLATRLDDASLIADLRRQGGTPEEVFESPELLQLTLDTLRSDYRVCDSYTWQRALPFDVPVHALAGREDAIGTEALIDWRTTTAGAFSLQWFLGGHFFIRQDEAALLQAIVRELLPTSRSPEVPAVSSVHDARAGVA